MRPRFIQIHTLHPHGASLLNRDEWDRAKRITIGGIQRFRISSHSRKYHIRMDSGPHSIRHIPGVPLSARSRDAVNIGVTGPLRLVEGVNQEVVNAIEREFNRGVYGPRGDSPENRQILMLGLPEVEWLRERAAAICAASPDDPEAARREAAALFSGKEGRANMKAFRESARLPAGIESALFGRMMTADPGANARSAMQVAHSFGVSAIESEVDYFQAMDDLRLAQTGAAHMGETELTTGVYYGYICIDVPTLTGNLEGEEPDRWLETDRELTGEVARRLITLAATATSGAKAGQTAPYSYASVVLVEIGERMPRQLSDAYTVPCEPDSEAAARAMSAHLEKMDAMYGREEARRAASTTGVRFPGAESLPMAELSEWARGAILSGEAAL